MNRSLPPPRASTSSAEQRLQKEREREKGLQKEREERDKVHSFMHFAANVKSANVPCSFHVKKRENSISFISVSDDEPFVVDYYLTIKDDLDYQMCVQNVFVSKRKVAKICGEAVTSFSSVSKILHFLKDLASSKDKISHLKNLSENLLDLAKNEQDYSMQRKLLFISEQLSLAMTVKNARKYSSDLLTAALMWKTTSSALYRQLLNEDCLTLPTFAHLTRLSRALTTDTGMSESSKSYLKARFQKLEQREKLVVLMMDEIYCAERAEYASGTFYGGGNEMCKTMLSFMIKSVAGKYSDIVALFPIRNLDSEKILKHFHMVITTLSEIGFLVFAMSADNASPNRKFYVEELCSGSLTTSIPHPTIPDEVLFLLFDAVHNFKNVYNNFVTRKEFVYPAIENANADGSRPPEKKALFAHIAHLYNMELGKPVKLAYKLSEKVLNPTNIEKTNVLLADSCFHESTIAGLRFYANNGYPEFADTANFLYVIRSWWNILNVKTPTLGSQKRNKYMKPVSMENQNNLGYLNTFASWLQAWQQISKCKIVKSCLTDETFLATIQTTKASVEVAQTLLEKDYFEYVLLGNLQSDPIEKRFGWYRQLAGGNYFISVRQILEAEKSIRLKSLLKFSGLSMLEVKETFVEGSSNQDLAINQETSHFLEMLEHNITDFSPVQVEDANIVFYVAGCYARSLSKEQKCQSCVQLLKKRDDVPDIIFDTETGSQHFAEKQQFLEQVNRGGLCYPSDLTYVTCLHAWNFYHDIQKQQDAFEYLVCSTGPKIMFTQSFIILCSQVSETQNILSQTCENGHCFAKLFERLVIKMFNTFAKNLCSEKNSNVHKGKKRSLHSKDGRKILQSQ